MKPDPYVRCHWAFHCPKREGCAHGKNHKIEAQCIALNRCYDYGPFGVIAWCGRDEGLSKL